MDVVGTVPEKNIGCNKKTIMIPNLFAIDTISFSAITNYKRY